MEYEQMPSKPYQVLYMSNNDDICETILSYVFTYLYVVLKTLPYFYTGAFIMIHPIAFWEI